MVKKQSKNISEKLIRAKAHQIWRKKVAKGESNNSSDVNWYEAEKYFNNWYSRLIFRAILVYQNITIRLWQLITIPFRLLYKIWQLIKYFGNAFSDPSMRSFDLNVVQTIISFFSLFATIFAGLGLYFSYEQGKERLITDRFAKAIEQIGDKNNESVRIGGIFSLEKIVQDSPKDYPTIMEVLTSYIRTQSPILEATTKKIKKVSIDVQAVLTVIRRCNPKLETDVQYNYFDLNNTNLKGANLEGANLERANLEGTNLERANLEKVNLKEASLKEATLTGATLIGANLYRANLEKVNLTGVNLEGANLEGAYLGGANLEGTYFIKVKNLTSEQVKEALNWQKAFYEPRFQKELGLSSGNSNF